MVERVRSAPRLRHALAGLAGLGAAVAVVGWESYEKTYPSVQSLFASVNRFAEQVQLKGLRPRTVEAYVAVVRHLGAWDRGDPAGLAVELVRHFGFLSPAAKARYVRVRGMLRAAAVPVMKAEPWAVPCPCCGKALTLVGIRRHGEGQVRPVAVRDTS